MHFITATQQGTKEVAIGGNKALQFFALVDHLPSNCKLGVMQRL